MTGVEEHGSVGPSPTLLATRLLANIETVVVGKREEIKLVLSALVCGGHVLLEDVPGTAKTVLARAIAGSIEGATNARVQCTPDLQPTDVTGLSVFNLIVEKYGWDYMDKYMAQQPAFVTSGHTDVSNAIAAGEKIATFDSTSTTPRLKAQGIPTAIYYPKPLHRQTAYRAFPVAAGGLPVSDLLAGEVLSLPMHAYLDDAVQDRIVAAVRQAL